MVVVFGDLKKPLKLVKMTILVLGGKGKTSSRLASILQENHVSFVVGSRSPSENQGFKHLRFDWLDESTYDIPFDSVSDTISAIYMVAPPILDCTPPMKAFIDHARSKGTKRFVLLSSSVIPRGGPFYGQVHEYLANLGVEYGVLRPSWFMENFSDQQHRGTVGLESTIYSAAEDGRIPFVSADDIAALAFHLLTDVTSHNTEYFVRGPELLSYDDVANIISKVTGRNIKHKRLTVAELQGKFVGNGMPEDYAATLAGLDGLIAKGLEAHLDDEVLKVTGRAPKSFRTFAQENREHWL